jgi:hypothetical protein
VVSDYTNEWKKIIDELNKFIEIIHPYNDGKSCARVIDVCLDFLDNKQVKKTFKPYL